VAQVGRSSTVLQSRHGHLETKVLQAAQTSVTPATTTTEWPIESRKIETPSRWCNHHGRVPTYTPDRLHRRPLAQGSTGGQHGRSSPSEQVQDSMTMPLSPERQVAPLYHLPR
jgi:hypothetical protein